MKNLKEQKQNVENVQAVDVELNGEQLDVVAGGVWGGIDGGGCTPTFPWETKSMPDVIVPKAPDVIENLV
jgi:hypothetical protein